MDDLPTEIVEAILACVGPLPHVLAVCRRWRNIVKDNRVVSSRHQRLSPADYMAHLARHGHLELLKWAQSRGCRWDSWTRVCAAMHGHVDVYAWAAANGCPENLDLVYKQAIIRGRVDVLEWLLSEGTPCHPQTCAWAAQCGQIGVLDWAKDRGCPWDYKICLDAARNGHWQVIEWATDNGWYDRPRDRAADEDAAKLLTFGDSPHDRWVWTGDRTGHKYVTC